MRHTPEGPSEAIVLRAVLAAAGRARLRTRGESMLPAIAPGTVVTVEALPLPRVVPGDVVAAAVGARIIVHRVVATAPDVLLTAGDNLPLLDPVVGPDGYLGVVPEYRAAVPPRQPDLSALGPPPRDHQHDDGPGRTRLLVPGPVAGHRSTGLDVRQCERPERPGCLAGPVIGISPFGALPPETLDTVLRAAGGRDLTLLVGYSFGYPQAADGGRPLLPPDSADLHVRFGSPLDPPGLAATLDFAADRVRALRPTPPAVAPPAVARPAATTPPVAAPPVAAALAAAARTAAAALAAATPLTDTHGGCPR
ncbi:peptidase S24-like protein [Streptomyces sp. 1114.5]|uniref:S24/S26 family peptidase n=1 Tax=Streptomyces sp. 1114.5 TaxID=1938830 RepID=UPI000EB07F0B|nr:S24/S26 family peptidase [Streptomyces sp. 1114.5]RKT19161.1 peptidase S24-like protein [Streptomyces sp. 1114.5]